MLLLGVALPVNLQLLGVALPVNAHGPENGSIADTGTLVGFGPHFLEFCDTKMTGVLSTSRLGDDACCAANRPFVVSGVAKTDHP